MADVDARHAALLEPPDQAVQTLGIVLRQAARRLVEDDEVRALPDRRRDLENLLLPYRQLTNGTPHVERRLDGREHRFRAAPHLAFGNEPVAGRHRAEAKILGDRQVLAERQFLVHHRDACSERVGGTGKPDRLALDEDVTARRAHGCPRGSCRACSCLRRSRRTTRGTTRLRSRRSRPAAPPRRETAW